MLVPGSRESACVVTPPLIVSTIEKSSPLKTYKGREAPIPFMNGFSPVVSGIILPAGIGEFSGQDFIEQKFVLYSTERTWSKETIMSLSLRAQGPIILFESVFALSFV